MSAPENRCCLGVVAYCWGLNEQSRLLAEGLAPLVARLRQQGLERFWFDRFDARGPHVWALFTVQRAQLAGTRELVERELAQFLAAHPSTTALSPEELSARHRACRGSALTVVDAEEGLADNNTLRFFEQPADRYPFSLGRSLENPDALHDLLDRSAAWSLGQLARAPAGVPIGIAADWLAGLARRLPEHFADSRAYWHYHAASLDRRFAPAEGEPAVPAWDREIGERNLALLERIWQRDSPPSPFLPRLLEVVSGAREARGLAPRALLREVIHMTLRQLGVPARLERLLVLFCWRQS